MGALLERIPPLRINNEAAIPDDFQARGIRYTNDVSQFEPVLGQVDKGETGSIQTKGPGGLWYRLKKSISESRFWRRLKAGYTNRENIGEFIASTIGGALVPGRVPHIVLVHDEQAHRVQIASQYVSATPSPLDNTIADKKQLAELMIFSALSGDHDVNLDNFVSANMKLIRIDLGHALNDLIRFRFPGGGKVSQNRIIDFFNRETVNGIGQRKLSKFWANHEDGLIPSQEMLDALTQFASSKNESKIAQGIGTATEALLQIEDPETQAKVIKSLKAIHQTLGGPKVRSKDYGEVLNAFFENLKHFYSQGMADARNAAKIMKLQLQIDQAIQKSDNTALTALEEKYAFTPIEWFKTNAEQKAFKGKIANYIAQRRRTLTHRSGIKA